MSEHARFGHPAGRDLGIPPSIMFWPMLIGYRKTKELLYTSRLIPAHEAQQIGLVNEVVDAEQLDEEVDRLVDAVLANGPEAVMAAKQLVFDIAGKPIDQPLIDATCESIAAIRVSEQGQEGLQAFLQKRKPHWLTD